MNIVRFASVTNYLLTLPHHSNYVCVCFSHYKPFSVETLGVFGEEARSPVRDVGRRLCAATGDPREPSYLRQRISVAIQRGNAASIRGTLRFISQSGY